MDDITKKPISVQGIPLDALFTISISGGFYGRLHNLLMFLSQQKSLEEFTLILQNLKAGEPKNAYEDQLLTVLILINECELSASKQGKIKSISLPEELK